MRALDRKVLRDLWHLRGQVLAIGMVVAAGIAGECLVELSYAIGRTQPVAVRVDVKDSQEDARRLEQVVPTVFPLSPSGIIDQLNLLRPIYRQTSVFGHFGRELPAFRWEAVDKREELRRALGKTERSIG